MERENKIIFGIRAVIEALNAGKEIEKALVRKGSGSDLFREMVKKLREHNVHFQYVPQEKLNRTTKKNHQGVIAFLSEISYSDLSMVLPGIYESGEIPLILILDRVSDVRNFGAIARTAICAGVHAIVIPLRGSAMINADAVKTSAGALHSLPVCRFENLLDAVRLLKDSGLHIFAASEKSSALYYEADFNLPAAIIMGAEDKGILSELLNASDAPISIPMKGAISSLNVSVAAGIILFEVLRQRKAFTQAAADG